MTIDERDLTPVGVFTTFTTFPLEPSLAADLLSRGDGLQRNLDRAYKHVRDEAIAEFMDSPAAKAVHAELVAEAQAQADEATARITGEPPDRPRDGVRIRDEDGPYDDAHLDGPASGYTMVAVDMDDAEAYGATVPEDGRWRPKLVHPCGRWRSKKRALRQLADELGYPECMEVAHPEQIDGAVGQAGVRLRDFYKLRRVRVSPAMAKAERAQRRVDRREMARAIAKGDPPF